MTTQVDAALAALRNRADRLPEEPGAVSSADNACVEIREPSGTTAFVGGNQRREVSALDAEVVVVNGHHLFGPTAG